MAVNELPPRGPMVRYTLDHASARPTALRRGEPDPQDVSTPLWPSSSSSSDDP
jgi:hypothetical protein